MMYWGPGMGGWGMLLMTVSSVLFWVLLTAGVMAVVRYVGRTRAGRPVDQSRTPRQLLAERFARGEIDEEEYRRRVQVLDEAELTRVSE